MLRDNSVTICGITGTWLKSVDKAKFAEIHDMGFDVLSCPRKGRGGGIAFLFDPLVISPIRNDVKRYSSFEVLECVLKGDDNMLRLSVVYRSTQSKNYDGTKVSKFMQEFDEYLDTLVGKSGSPIICGDFNFHVENNTNSTAINFISLCESKGFIQHIQSPTHISGGTLDLIFTLGNISDALPVLNTAVESNTGTLSDHYLVSFQTHFSNVTNKQHSYTEKLVRELDKIDIAEFRHDIFSSELNLSEYRSLDETVDLYQRNLERIFDKHAPLITRKFCTERSEFWNENCQSARRERRKAKRRSKKHPNDKELRAIHHEKSVDADITINMARNSYYERMLSQHKGDARATYKVINKLLDKEFGAKKLPNGKDEEIAENLKTHFDQKVKKIYSNIQSEITKCAPKIDESIRTHEPSKQKSSPKLTHFQEISEEKLESIIKALPNKSSLLDPIPMWLFKHCLPELLPVVHYIVNESLRTGKFPSALKEASIRPVTKIHNDILMMIDKKENVVLLLLDLSAAFDTINHRLLLNKLQSMYGINDVAISWLSSYLSNRSFRVTVNQKTSGECLLDIGVPQGSILGPLLFILYTKDLESIVTKFGFTLHLYADDTQIYFAFDVHSDSPDMQAIDLCCSVVKKWMAANFLKLNEDKTEFIEIGPYVSPITSLRIAGTDLKPVDKAKNLGFLFDHQMNLDAQINAVSQVCYMNQRDLSKIGSKLSFDLKAQMVHSNILCFIDYCNSVYETARLVQVRPSEVKEVSSGEKGLALDDDPASQQSNQLFEL
ncbi:hypothetical protein ACHWQZ_G014934 [Mnemiopsis leidyi]